MAASILIRPRVGGARYWPVGVCSRGSENGVAKNCPGVGVAECYTGAVFFVGVRVDSSSSARGARQGMFLSRRPSSGRRVGVCSRGSENGVAKNGPGAGVARCYTSAAIFGENMFTFGVVMT